MIDKCFSRFDSITIQNPTNKAWTGEIRVTKNENGVKKKLNLSCSGCTGAKFVGKIVVDGNEDGKNQTRSWCLYGNTCSFKIKGKK